nr:MAG TPA: hypothetical protein [Caudoviricetes sp.]
MNNPFQWRVSRAIFLSPITKCFLPYPHCDNYTN